MIKDKGVVMVDIKFIDLLGTWQHFAAPVSEFRDEVPFEEGLGFDGSSIRLRSSLSACVVFTSDKLAAQCGQDRISLFNHLNIEQEYIKLFVCMTNLGQFVYWQRI